MSDYDVVTAAGSLRSTSVDAIRFPHRWTPDGVTAGSSRTAVRLP
jgi:hypothetical protein